MRFVPKLKLRTRLITAFFLAILLSYGFSMLTFHYFIEQDFLRARRELAAQGIDLPDHHGPEAHALHPGGDRRHYRSIVRPKLWPRVLPVETVFALLLSIVAGAWISRRITRPLGLLEEGAHNFHERDWEHRIPEAGDDEIARVAASMNEMAERVEGQISALEDDSRRRQQLLADVAHELRSPIATLKTMAEALRDGVANQPDRRDRALQSMVAMADRMQRLVTDLLELARLDLRELPLHRTSVTLRHVAEESLAVHADDAVRAGVTLCPLQVDNDAAVNGDALRLAQILDNLVNNAIAHAGAGAEVCVRIGAAGGKAVLTVSDTGRGIPGEHLPFVFDPFYRLDSARNPNERHSGLGLRIARGLAEAHDGTLTLDSEEGKGTIATLTLPLG
ncbi:MAG TPA: HAMP domain-containing sensor histidine kinase [Armatimonadota bacterium]|jgi:two-component system sensor histidine kinase BaeS